MLVEVAELAESHHVFVERDPLVELADLDVADDVVDPPETDGGTGWCRRQADGHVARAVVTRVVAAIDEGVLGLAVGADRSEAEGAVLVGEFVRFAHRRGTAGDRSLVRGGGIVDDEGEVLGAISVLANMGPDGRIGGEPGGDDQPDVALLEQVRGDVVAARFGAGVGGDLEPERGGEEPGHRTGVTDVELE